MLAARYGVGEEGMRANMRRVEELAAAEGLDYDLPNGVSGNTLLAHQLIHLAAAHGVGGEMKERLLRANFVERRSVFDVDALVPLAVEVGLNADEVRQALADQRFLPAVRDDIATARALGCTGVPFFAVDRTYGAAGAQPAEVLLQLLERAWADSHPLTVVPAADGCDDESCATAPPVD
jgi:predicted DsbA family dithiol-disulfide isomerase